MLNTASRNGTRTTSFIRKSVWDPSPRIARRSNPHVGAPYLSLTRVPWNKCDVNFDGPLMHVHRPKGTPETAHVCVHPHFELRITNTVHLRKR